MFVCYRLSGLHGHWRKLFNSVIPALRQIVTGIHCTQVVPKAWFTLAMEAETETAHPSVSAWSPVITCSHLEVCDVSSTEAEEATEKRNVPFSFQIQIYSFATLVSYTPFVYNI